LWLWHQHDRPYAQIAVGRWHWITKLIEGNFPNYHQVIPNLDGYGGLVRISDADATRLLSVLPKLPGFKDKDSKLVLSVTTEKGAFLRTASGLPKVHVALDRSEIVRPVATEVAFNSRFFLSALQHGLRDLHARDHVSPLVMTDATKLQVWMPLRDIVTPPEAAPADASSPEASATPSDPSSESPSPVVPTEPAPQAPAVSENQPIVSVTHNPPTTMVAPATNPPVSQTREDTAKPGVVASPRVIVTAPEIPVSVADALQTKFGKVRDLLRDLGNELGSIQVLVKESGRQFKALERDHEALKKNIRALREVNV
jgi:DNA polymerase-3 subunit beta